MEERFVPLPIRTACVLLILSLCAPPLSAQQTSDTPPPAQKPEIREQVNITAARTRLPVDETPASVTILDAGAATRAAAQTTDDLLRQVPGFSNFRRSSSSVANPTTQGVSLRGAGASGASRTLILVDGIPLNDAFGGWVYWDRVPRQSIEQLEIVRGGASDLYGSDALSGVINLVTFSRPGHWGSA
ncbi:MAG: TonB-dependent receptor plug domain-containing protein, partial [Blastocatellia bacterium]